MSQIPTPDFETYSMAVPLIEAYQNDDVIEIAWKDGKRARFHMLWLRDNDASSASIAERSRERVFSLLDIPQDIKALSLEISAEGGLRVRWSDGVDSHYHPGWLREHDYSDPRSKSKQVDRVIWGRNLESNMPLFSAEQVTSDPQVRVAFLRTLRSHGLAILRDAPTEAEHFEELASLAGMLRDMNWGKVFDVDSRAPDAYLSSTELPMEAHSDAPTREYMPGLQIFQCVTNTTIGGETFWVDGFNIAELMATNHPEAYKLLTTVPWPHASRNRANNYFTEFPLFQCDNTGNIEAVRDTPWLRAPLRAAFDLTPRIYDAYRLYVELKSDRAHQVERRLQPGEIAFVDNRRCLHGRRSINASVGHRHFRTAYGEREEMLSTLRFLERQLAVSTQTRDVAVEAVS